MHIIAFSIPCPTTQTFATRTPATVHITLVSLSHPVGKGKTNSHSSSLQSSPLLPVNGGINMFEWRKCLSFVGVEGSVISCLGSQEAGASIQPVCACVCVVCMRASVCMCEIDYVHQREGHELKQTKRSWIILFKRLPVLLIYTFSTCCSCTSGPVACSWDKQQAVSHCLWITPLQHNPMYCHLSKTFSRLMQRRCTSLVLHDKTSAQMWCRRGEFTKMDVHCLLDVLYFSTSAEDQ